MSGPVVIVFALILAVGTLSISLVDLHKKGELGQLFSFSTSTAVARLKEGPQTKPKLEPVVSVSVAPRVPISNEPPPATPQKPQIEPPPGFTLRELSPYYQKIRISSVNPSSGQTSFTLRFAASEKEPINVTRWRLRANHGDTLIPHAVQDFQPFGSAQDTDIVLVPNGTLSLFSNQSAIPGKNLRLNKCIGYLNNMYLFRPALPNTCPNDVDRYAISRYSGKCQSFLLSMGGSCRTPTPQEKNQLSAPPDTACQKELEKFTYTNCYTKHRYDLDFFSPNWYVWLGREPSLDPSHDRILLLDAEGLLVDVYLY